MYTTPVNNGMNYLSSGAGFLPLTIPRDPIILPVDNEEVSFITTCQRKVFRFHFQPFSFSVSQDFFRVWNKSLLWLWKKNQRPHFGTISHLRSLDPLGIQVIRPFDFNHFRPGASSKRSGSSSTVKKQEASFKAQTEVLPTTWKVGPSTNRCKWSYKQRPLSNGRKYI